ncbi:MAG: hypothetical protein UT13_C0002G0010 [Candidatus Pacebacteria bacterium GW2011_GWF2_38_9]|nr:MAG: hypothetical protein UT13_C0002G0010 [Candidatus Pacebacteria bacterium GW2011_GWF2_38_9]
MQQKRQTFKDIEMEGRKFRIKEFTPDVGSYWAFKFFGSSFSVSEDKEKAEKRIQEFFKMPRNEYKELQNDCLKSCFEILPAGETPIVNNEGNFSVVNLSPAIVLNLVMTTFQFNLEPFFVESLSKPLPESAEQSFSQNTQI